MLKGRAETGAQRLTQPGLGRPSEFAEVVDHLGLQDHVRTISGLVANEARSYHSNRRNYAGFGRGDAGTIEIKRHRKEVRLTYALCQSGLTGMAHTIPSLKPADPMSNPIPKRPLMFSMAIRCVSSMI